jgi:hypothetical protein
MHVERSADGKSGKEAALAGLYDEYYDRIARYIFAVIGD